jgi:hypothetical protein
MYSNKQNVDRIYSYFPGIINRIASSWLFQLLGHLSYCVYLIHTYVIEAQILVAKEPIDLSALWIVSTFDMTPIPLAASQHERMTCSNCCIYLLMKSSQPARNM